MAKKKLDVWQFEPWWTKQEVKQGRVQRYYVWKKDKRKKTGWRLFEVAALTEDLLKIITGYKK
tara:strand:- start:137 stop:325 length:189 start_codon:yes stop_codon:yes gene_type:complete